MTFGYCTIPWATRIVCVCVWCMCVGGGGVTTYIPENTIRVCTSSLLMLLQDSFYVACQGYQILCALERPSDSLSVFIVTM